MGREVEQEVQMRMRRAEQEEQDYTELLHSTRANMQVGDTFQHQARAITLARCTALALHAAAQETRSQHCLIVGSGTCDLPLSDLLTFFSLFSALGTHTRKHTCIRLHAGPGGVSGGGVPAGPGVGLAEGGGGAPAAGGCQAGEEEGETGGASQANAGSRGPAD